MAEKPEDFNMPSAVVSKLMKDALPEGVVVSNDARSASSRATSIFILYLTTCANNIAINNKRKTLTAQDIMSAISDMGFHEFTTHLTEWQNSFRTDKAKRDRLKAKRVAQNHLNQVISQTSQFRNKTISGKDNQLSDSDEDSDDN